MNRFAQALVVAVVVVIGVPGMAFASWQGLGTGRGYGKAVSVPQGNAPTAVVTGRDVTVTWPIVRLPDTTPVGGYRIARFDAGTGASQTVLAGCNGTVTLLTCTETGVAPGSWVYATRPVQALWLGSLSSNSSSVTVASPSLSLVGTTLSALPSTLSGSIASFLDGESVTFRLDNATSGTVLAGSTIPSPVPTGGSATVSVTIPAGTSLGTHTVYAVGSLGSTASTTVQVVDTTAPTVSAVVVAKTQGGTPGFIKQGGTYFVYANAADSGSTASGVGTVTANVSSMTTGGTAVALVAGSYSVGGVSYGYRTASITANNPLAAGAKAFTVIALDVAGNSGSLGGTATVDNTAPSATDIQTANKVGGTLGKAEAGDTITFTFSEAVEPGTILAGWTGTATSVTLRLNNGGAGNDTVTVFDSTNTTQLNLGSVNLGRTDYTTANVTFTGSTMTMTGNTVAIVLGTAGGTTTTAASTGTMTWTPSAVATDRAANACSTTARTETGTVDRDF